ncbi:MAG TPA: hypothetical protein PKA41_17310 [Verrucomicrobiota bacterium]|nr:hypothetical protein [Verrucomicrobiota bacterium]
MDLLKKHYEKILLGLVLVGLAVGTAFLPLMITGERQDLNEKANQILSVKVEPLQQPDLARQTDVFKRTETPLTLDFSTGNRLFNPVPWVKSTDGRPIKAQEGNIGPKAVTVTKTSPLFTIISLENVSVSETGVRYVVAVERQAAQTAAQRRKKPYYASLNDKNDVFIIREVRGPAEAPTELVLELGETGELITLGKDAPFKREDGYLADLKYDPERKTWTARRVGMEISFGGETYIVVAISKDEVVLSAKSNNKKTPIPYRPAP